MARSAAGAQDNEDLGAEWREADGERRTAAQFDYDSFWGITTAGIRASAADTAPSAVRSIPEVIVTTTAADLRDPERGAGWIGGLRVPVRTVERICCGADVRLTVEGDAGEPMWLGRSERLFSGRQRKALIARFQGCAWPGCGAPAAWCDSHHVAWFRRDEGRTDVGNGILLCSFHHHLIHAGDCRWRIVVHDGRPHLVPRAWTGPPEPEHRMQEHPRRAMQPPREDDLWGRSTRTR